jgi:hypothetical protein
VEKSGSAGESGSAAQTASAGIFGSVGASTQSYGKISSSVEKSSGAASLVDEEGASSTGASQSASVRSSSSSKAFGSAGKSAFHKTSEYSGGTEAVQTYGGVGTSGYTVSSGSTLSSGPHDHGLTAIDIPTLSNNFLRNFNKKDGSSLASTLMSGPSPSIVMEGASDMEHALKSVQSNLDYSLDPDNSYLNQFRSGKHASMSQKAGQSILASNPQQLGSTTKTSKTHHVTVSKKTGHTESRSGATTVKHTRLIHRKRHLL